MTRPSSGCSGRNRRTWPSIGWHARWLRSARSTWFAEARLLALLNVALADAVIASWDGKYRYGTWRPVSAIRTTDDYGNPNTVANPTWTPLIETPNSPDYPSELSTCGAAALRVLSHVLGSDDVAFSLDSSTTVRVRSFASFSAAEDELTASTWYSGVSFKPSAEAGRTLGQQVADQVVQRILQALALQRVAWRTSPAVPAAKPKRRPVLPRSRLPATLATPRRPPPRAARLRAALRQLAKAAARRRHQRRQGARKSRVAAALLTVRIGPAPVGLGRSRWPSCSGRRVSVRT